ncbi:MAG TPA: CGNR zinc finger domain-containing protein [Candidatus Tumulicola sp.]|nr:CGNR zinc finger domain-containing protein [Candidatus Tumulicola sp.]
MASPSESDQAPARLDVLRRFVNTLDYPAGPDALGTPGEAAKWCRAAGLPPVTNQAETERLRGFREALREVLFANNGESTQAAAWEGMRPYLTAVAFQPVADGRGGIELEPAGAADGAIGTMLVIAYEAMAAGTWSRLRACRKSSCRFAYYDCSRNGSRAWCSMAVCGNREKAQRRRTRERHGGLA